MSYWDTSCIVKLYTPEPDFEMLRDFLAQDGALNCKTTNCPLQRESASRFQTSFALPSQAREVRRQVYIRHKPQ